MGPVTGLIQNKRNVPASSCGSYNTDRNLALWQKHDGGGGRGGEGDLPQRQEPPPPAWAHPSRPCWMRPCAPRNNVHMYMTSVCLHLKEGRIYGNSTNSTKKIRFHLACHSKFPLCSLKISKEPVFYSTVIPHSVHTGTTRHLGSCSKRGIFWRQTSERLITSTWPCASVNATASPGTKLATTHVGNFVNSTLVSWPLAFTLSRSTTHQQNWILRCLNYPRSPLSWFHSERFCFRSLASGSPSSKPLLTREVSPVHCHQHAGWIHPQALHFLNCGKGVSPFSCLPQRGGQPTDTPQPQRKGNKAGLRTRYWFNKEFAGIHQVLKPDFSLHKQTIWTANHLGHPGYQRLHQGTSLENWYVFLKGQLKRNP